MYVMSPDGSNVRLLAKKAWAPAVSPNGQQIAFVRDGAIWVMRRDVVREKASDRAEAKAYGPAWSADGNTIYFTTDVLLSIRSDGTHLRQLTTRKGAGINFVAASSAPSPDGRIIAYTAIPDDPPSSPFTELRAVTPSGRSARLPFRIADIEAGGPGSAAWAPNGQRLAYDAQGVWQDSGKPGVDWGIYVSSRGSSPPHRIVGPKMTPTAPAWSRDGAWIVFVGSSHPGFAGSDDIWLVRSDGTGLRQITKTNGDEYWPTWLPPV